MLMVLRLGWFRRGSMWGEEVQIGLSKGKKYKECGLRL
jgi:hypothetical protein